jgi:RNA polymerase sigma-70 factor, ECF subfamily
VYGLALRILGDSAVAEEVTIDVYAYVWRQAASYAPERGTPSAWLFMLTRSRALDHLRADKRQKLLSAPAGGEAPSGVTTPEESIVMTEQQHLVQEAFAKLVPEQRQVLELAYFSGLSHSDIATSLGLPLGTVKTRLRLGMLKLRELIYPLVEEI